MRTKKTVVILISGKAGNGKTTIAEMVGQKLAEYKDIATFKYSFAQPIKFIAQAFFGWNKEKDEKGRKLLQDIGRVGREYDIDIWVKHLLNQMDKQSGALPFNFVIVDDWRFFNEAIVLSKNPLLDILTVRVEGRVSEMPGNTWKDVSEHGLPTAGEDEADLYNFVIDNSGGLEQLNEEVEDLMRLVEKRFILE